MSRFVGLAQNGLAGARRATIAFVFVTVVLDVIALGIVVPVLPKLVLTFEGGDTADAAKAIGVFGTAWALMQFVFAPILGALSDRVGRRPVILLSSAGLGLDYVVMALAPSLAWLFLGRVLSGITAATFSTAGAYVADVTPPEKRAAGFGMIGAGFGVGFVLGPAIGGLLGQSDPRLPFWVAAAFSAINTGYGLFVLPESLPPERRAPFSWRRANPVGSLVLLRSHPELTGLATVNFLRNLAHVVLPSTFVLYTIHRYAWDARAVGISLAAIGVSSMVVQGLLVGPVVARMGERGALLFGLACGAIGFVVEGMAPTGGMFLTGIPWVALWGIAGAATQGLMTRRVAADEQGQLQGANGSLFGIAELVGPAMFTLTFARFVGPWRDVGLPGAPFLLSALLLVVAMGMAWPIARRAAAP